MRQEAPWTHLGEDILVKFQPGLVALAVRVLQPEEPDLPQPYRFHHLSNMIFEPFSNLLCMFTWSKSCLPVVLGWMANSSSASIVVTRTFTGFGILRLLKSCSERRISDPETLRLRDCWTPFFLDQLFFSGPMYARQCSKLLTTKAFLTSLTNMWLKGRNGGKGWRNLCGQSSGGRRWGRWCTALPLIARPCEPGARNCSAKYSWWWMPYLWINNLLRQKKGIQ